MKDNTKPSKTGERILRVIKDSYKAQRYPTMEEIAEQIKKTGRYEDDLITVQ